MRKRSKYELLAEEYLRLTELYEDNGIYTTEELDAALTEYKYIIHELGIDAEIYAEVFKLLNGEKGATQFKNVADILKAHGHKFNICDILYWTEEIEFILSPEEWRIAAACLEYITSYCIISPLPIKHRA